MTYVGIIITFVFVNNFILTLRQKLEDDPAHPRPIVTIRQVGYNLVP